MSPPRWSEWTPVVTEHGAFLESINLACHVVAYVPPARTQTQTQQAQPRAQALPIPRTSSQQRDAFAERGSR